MGFSCLTCLGYGSVLFAGLQHVYTIASDTAALNPVTVCIAYVDRQQQTLSRRSVAVGAFDCCPSLSHGGID